MGGQAMGCTFTAVDPTTGDSAPVTPDVVARKNDPNRSAAAKAKMSQSLCGDLHTIYEGEILAADSVPGGPGSKDKTGSTSADHYKDAAKARTDAKKGGCDWAQ
jgi:hypothetical protein